MKHFNEHPRTASGLESLLLPNISLLGGLAFAKKNWLGFMFSQVFDLSTQVSHLTLSPLPPPPKRNKNWAPRAPKTPNPPSCWRPSCEAALEPITDLAVPGRTFHQSSQHIVLREHSYGRRKPNATGFAQRPYGLLVDFKRTTAYIYIYIYIHVYIYIDSDICIYIYICMSGNSKTQQLQYIYI